MAEQKSGYEIVVGDRSFNPTALVVAQTHARVRAESELKPVVG